MQVRPPPQSGPVAPAGQPIIILQGSHETALDPLSAPVGTEPSVRRSRARQVGLVELLAAVCTLHEHE